MSSPIRMFSPGRRHSTSMRSLLAWRVSGCATPRERDQAAWRVLRSGASGACSRRRAGDRTSSACRRGRPGGRCAMRVDDDAARAGSASRRPSSATRRRRRPRALARRRAEGARSVAASAGSESAHERDGASSGNDTPGVAERLQPAERRVVRRARAARTPLCSSIADEPFGERQERLGRRLDDTQGGGVDLHGSVPPSWSRSFPGPAGRAPSMATVRDGAPGTSRKEQPHATDGAGRAGRRRRCAQGAAGARESRSSAAGGGGRRGRRGASCICTAGRARRGAAPWRAGQNGAARLAGMVPAALRPARSLVMLHAMTDTGPSGTVPPARRRSGRAGNPGPAASGYVLADPDGRARAAEGWPPAARPPTTSPSTGRCSPG